MPRRLLVLTLFFSSLTPATVSADWLVTPFAGVKFGGAICPGTACPGVNDLADPEDATGLRKFTFGGAFGLLTDGVLGLQTDFAYIPGYFDRGGARINLVAASGALTLTGDVLLALPAAVTRDGLRPYLAVGAGLIRWSRRNPDDVFNVSTNQFAFAVGGGALGRLTDRTSARFELRRVVGRDDEALRYGLSLWRATVGIAIRY